MKRKTVSLITLLLLIIMVSLLWVFLSSQASLNQAEEEALALIALDHEVDHVNDFYWMTTDKSYFSLDFVDKNEDQYYAIIEREGGDIHYYKKGQIITEDDARSITASEVENPKILQTRLGMFHNQPAWEMTLKNKNGTLSYLILDALTGEWIQTISNI